MSARTPAAPLRFPNVPALDGVRGLAAVAVVVHHCIGANGAPAHITNWMDATQAAASFGYLGVDLFFVLSGYLITSLLLLARRRPSYYGNFYWKRVFRILPALLLVLALIRLFWPHQVPWNAMLLALFFLSNIPLFWSVPSIGPFWSLATEEQFYLLWPTVVHRTRRASSFICCWSSSRSRWSFAPSRRPSTAAARSTLRCTATGWPGERCWPSLLCAPAFPSARTTPSPCGAAPAAGSSWEARC